MSSNNPRKNKWLGRLYPEEIALAREVFADTLPYDRIFISKTNTHTQGITLATSPIRGSSGYCLLWGDAHSRNIAESSARMKETFIHELVHVWQGQYAGISGMSYMRQSAWNQFSYGVGDIFKSGLGTGVKRIGGMFKNGFVKGWDQHRGKAYCFPVEKIGENFNTFNVEQQAILIETWFMKESCVISGIEYAPGFQSEDDPRFAYVRDCIRKGNPNAPFIF